MYHYVYVSSLHLWPCPLYSLVPTERRQRITCSLKWDKAATPGWGLPLVLEQPSQLSVCVNRHFSALQLTLWKLVSGPSGDLSSSVNLAAYHLSLLILSLAACPPRAIFVLRAPSHVNEQSYCVVSTVASNVVAFDRKNLWPEMTHSVPKVFLLSIYAVWYKIRGNNVKFCLCCWDQMSPQG